MCALQSFSEIRSHIKILFSSALAPHWPWPPILISVLFHPGKFLAAPFFILRVFWDYIYNIYIYIYYYMCMVRLASIHLVMNIK